MDVYHEIQPDRYVLLLAEGPATGAADILARCLRQAWRSGKSSVWVDCSRLHHMPAQARDLLLRYQKRLGGRSVKLVLSQASPAVQSAFEHVAPEARPEMRPS